MQEGFKSLIAWQKAMLLARLTYTITNEFPHRESWALASQMQRAAVSIPSNIAEGSRRSTRKEYMQFLRIAYGSLGELETQFMIAQEQYPNPKIKEAVALLSEISKMLHTLISKLKL